MFDIRQIDAELNLEKLLLEMFDAYRLVEVESHDIYDYHNGVFSLSMEGKCYEIWNREEPCKNCSSQAALEEWKQIIKLECLGNKVYFIVSQPVEIGGKKMVLELVKDITDRLLANDGRHPVNLSLSDLVDNMNDLIVHDPLTGIFNRRFYDKELSNCIQRFGGKIKEIYLVIMDVDKMKHINDDFGHSMGDDVLKAVAGCIRDNTKGDMCWCSRIGGDEFAAVFCNFTLEKVEMIMERIRTEIHNLKFIQPETLDISYGMVRYRDGMTPKEILQEADSKMYENKRIK